MDALNSQAPALSRVLVTVATYNEAENIRLLLNQIRAHLPHADILVVDDNSPDGTGRLVEEHRHEDQRVFALHRAGKLGLGSAMLDAIDWALGRDYEFLVNLDADFSHPPECLPILIDGMARADVTIGSRYIPGGQIVGWDFIRHVMSFGINAYARILLRLHARDTSGAFRCYRLSKLRLIGRENVLSRGYSFQEEYLFHCQRVGCRIKEFPITFVNRKQGKSKINRQEVLKALWILLVVAFRY